MRGRFLLAIICLISLVAELSFDNTTSFVRVAAASPAASVIAFYAPAGDPDASRSAPVGQNDGAPSQWEHSVGHAARVAAPFEYSFRPCVSAVTADYVWHYRDIDRFTPLRPPIPA
jgi:hypothetical protein